MKLVRFIRSELEGYGVYADGRITPVLDIFDPVVCGDSFDASEAVLLAPCEPTKMVCAGLNYTDHAIELNMPIPDEPIIFLKPSTSALDPDGVVLYPELTHQLEFEAELAVVIGKKAKSVPVEDAAEYILGYTCMNDITARDLQRKDGQWTRAKSFDTFGPFGPWIETELDPCCATVEAYLNGVQKQCSNTKNMHYSPFQLVSFISQVMTLNPGDIIATGTPPGVGAMVVGDEIEVRISGIGSLKNRIGKQ